MARTDLPGLRCSSCACTYDANEAVWRCRCGGLLDLADFAPALPPAGELSLRPATLWRYAEALPVALDPMVSMGEGMSPLVPAPGRPDSWLKLDFIMPTLSFKDRGAVLLATLARKAGAARLVVDSSGNAGTAMAAYAARARLRCEVFVPAGTSPAKLVAMRAHGAAVHVVAGDRQAAAEAAQDALSQSGGTRYASHVYDPFFLHGTKTYAYEIWEQTGGRVPACWVLPVGNGTLLLGAYLGLRELVANGLLGRMPRLVGVQARACAPLAAAFEGGLATPVPIEPSPTSAEGIAIARPPRGAQVLEAVRATQGEIVTVDDPEVSAAQADLAGHGFFVEPTAAVCWAAVSQRGYEHTVVPLCGAGLKAVH